MREIDGIGSHAELFQNQYSKEQNQAFTAQFAELTNGFKDAQISGLAVSAEEVQALVRKHFEFCLQFWTPNRAAYKSLAQSYLLPTDYRDSYEAVSPGLAKYHHDAMVFWADQNLE